MKRGFLLCAALLAAAGCDKDETLPEPMVVGSGANKKKKSDDAPAGSADAPGAEQGKPSNCAPKAGEVCLIGAEVEHAAVLIHYVTGVNVVVVGSYDKRIDGVIPTSNPSAALDALAQQAELKHVEIGDTHYIGNATVIDRGAGGGAVNFCKEPQSMVVQRTDPQELAKRIVESGDRRLQGTIEGEITIAAINMNACAMVQHVVHMSGATGRVDAKALRITGDAALPKSSRAAGTPCAPLDSDKVLRQPCHKNVDLAVVGTGRIGEIDAAVVRRIGRIFEPVALIKTGEHVGDYHSKVTAIDATGLSENGKPLVPWSP